MASSRTLTRASASTSSCVSSLSLSASASACLSYTATTIASAFTLTNMLRRVSTLNSAYLSARALTTFPSLSPSVPSFSSATLSASVSTSASAAISTKVSRSVSAYATACVTASTSPLCRQVYPPWPLLVLPQPFANLVATVWTSALASTSPSVS